MYVHKNFLNTLWEFTRGVEEGSGSFMKKTLNVWKTFKLKSLKTPKLDVPPKKISYSLFYKIMQEKKKLKGATGSHESAIISRK